MQYNPSIHPIHPYKIQSSIDLSYRSHRRQSRFLDGESWGIAGSTWSRPTVISYNALKYEMRTLSKVVTSEIDRFVYIKEKFRRWYHKSHATHLLLMNFRTQDSQFSNPDSRPPSFQTRLTPLIDPPTHQPIHPYPIHLSPRRPSILLIQIYIYPTIHPTIHPIIHPPFLPPSFNSIPKRSSSYQNRSPEALFCLLIMNTLFLSPLPFFWRRPNSPSTSSLHQMALSVSRLAPSVMHRLLFHHMPTTC